MLMLMLMLMDCISTFYFCTQYERQQHEGLAPAVHQEVASKLPPDDVPHKAANDDDDDDDDDDHDNAATHLFVLHTPMTVPLAASPTQGPNAASTPGQPALLSIPCSIAHCGYSPHTS